VAFRRGIGGKQAYITDSILFFFWSFLSVFLFEVHIGHLLSIFIIYSQLISLFRSLNFKRDQVVLSTVWHMHVNVIPGSLTNVFALSFTQVHVAMEAEAPTDPLTYTGGTFCSNEYTDGCNARSTQYCNKYNSSDNWNKKPSSVINLIRQI
jgi:hypothetical protein